MSMTIEQFHIWVSDHCPHDRDYDELIERLALGAACLVEECSKRTGVPVDELLDKFYWQNDTTQ